ncbi:protein grainyhead-like isoform X5 [Argiope bruennichi]|uniref:protein grainyhead-like isoform X5 n=1 Tax=Argiope bruennichi TaxID=94029 RepID=UPI002493FCF4|nr:protein grainyhead-like isoform X5 [Argiope bruennichi]
MEADQTGFSGSPPNSVAGVSAAASTCSDDANNGDSTPPNPGGVNRNPTYYTNGANDITIKDEPEDDTPSVVVASNHTPLPSISEENWRAYYQPSLVVYNGIPEDQISVYEAATGYKLPPLGKFGKNLVGKLPASAIWSLAVPQPEPELITPHTDAGSPVPSPGQQPSDLSTQTVYLHRTDGTKVIVQSMDREDSVIQPVPDGVEGKAVDKDGGQALPLLAPAAVEVKQVEEPDVQEVEMDASRQRELQQAEASPHDIQLEGTPYQVGEFSPSSYEPLGTGQYSVLTNVVVTVAPPQYAQTAAASNAYAITPDYYREPTDQYTQAVRQHLATYPDAVDNVTYVERYIRQNYKPSPHGLTVDLPSPDSGIGETTVTPRDSLQQMFDYTDIAQQPSLLQPTDEDSSTSRSTPAPSSPSRKNSWNHEYGRNAELDKVQIPKIMSDVGFRYYLEAPISTSQRREDDRMTYINKGQYYGLTLEYINDPERQLRGNTVKSTVMLVFREEKSPEDELKAWKFWHSRQHSVKQRILDADTKNSCGIIGQIEEVTHNAIAFYWSPLDGPAKISVSVHCLSTDFSNQKGVKGFPLHIQIDTTDDPRESLPIHRGYCQIKVFCDKGAERKTRDEERRAAKRKLTATGTDQRNVFTGSRKKIEEMYHQPCDRSEFYSMSDLTKAPILFRPDEDTERQNGPELTFYAIAAPTEENIATIAEVKQPLEIPIAPPIKKFKLTPPDRVLLYVRRSDEEIFHALHLVPPNLEGLAKALESKYNISTSVIRHFYKKCKKGITVMMDDDIIRLYSNEDTFILDLIKTEDNKFDITLEEL